MHILLDNVNLDSSSGPNSFAQKLTKYMSMRGHTFELGGTSSADAQLCFIESHQKLPTTNKLITRFDGIYFNTLQDHKSQNENIKRTYEHSDGVIFQSNFNKELITRYFGEHPNSQVIHNGADVDLTNELYACNLNAIEDVWCCASSWRPHKRLNENIEYFLEHSGPLDLMVVAGLGYENREVIHDEKIIYVGNLSNNNLISLYKRSKYFVHLAWLDHCPNVVVDARAAGCEIICSSTGGTKEIAGKNAVVIEEPEWDFKPLNLYEPPKLNFDNKINNDWDIDYNMKHCASKYENYLNTVEKK